MTHEELSDLYELYVMGALDPEERAELEQHLATSCAQCKAGIRSALSLGAFMATLPDSIQPPKALRRRVLASIGVEPKSSRIWLSALAALSACLLISVLVLWIEDTRHKDELASVQAQLRQASTDLSRIEVAFRFLNEPETKRAVFGKGQPVPPRGSVFVNPRGVLLFASNLPPTPSDRTYELWILPKTGNAIPAGLFQSDAQGNTLYLRDSPVDMSATKAIAVTVEPASGSPAPTTTPIIVAALTD